MHVGKTPYFYSILGEEDFDVHFVVDARKEYSFIIIFWPIKTPLKGPYQSIPHSTNQMFKYFGTKSVLVNAIRPCLSVHLHFLKKWFLVQL